MPVQYKDYYQTLGVPKDATAEQVRKAYRKLARELHPDVNKAAGAEQRFKEVNEANEVLSDPEKRKRYDRLGANWQQYEQWQQQGGRRGDGNFEWAFTGPGGVRYGSAEDLEDLGGFSEFFRTFFGDIGGAATRTTTRRGTRSRPGPDLESVVEVTLPEAYRGTERAIEILDPTNGREPRRLTVKVPAGVRDGQRIRLAGAGATGTGGGSAGDLYLVVRVRDHPFFKRDGDDVRVDLPITLVEALLGADVVVPTLKGRVTLRIPLETQNGRVIRLAGQGMPRLRGSGHGDMFVTVKVVLPAKLSDDDKACLRKIGEHHKEDVRSHLL